MPDTTPPTGPKPSIYKVDRRKMRAASLAIRLEDTARVLRAVWEDRRWQQEKERGVAELISHAAYRLGEAVAERDAARAEAEQAWALLHKLQQETDHLEETVSLKSYSAVCDERDEARAEAEAAKAHCAVALRIGDDIFLYGTAEATEAAQAHLNALVAEAEALRARVEALEAAACERLCAEYVTLGTVRRLRETDRSMADDFLDARWKALGEEIEALPAEEGGDD